MRKLLIPAAVLVVFGASCSAAREGFNEGLNGGTSAPTVDGTPVDTIETVAEVPTQEEIAVSVAEDPAVTAPVVTAAPAPVETASQENAREMAANYLDVMAFSASGLVEQLVFEGFSHDDAAYGVFVVNADWNEQAAKSAASYLDTMPFSRSGLIDQLVFEGFSPEQAEYGVSTTGL